LFAGGEVSANLGGFCKAPAALCDGGGDLHRYQELSRFACGHSDWFAQTFGMAGGSAGQF
jgi:hypothetical protein